MTDPKIDPYHKWLGISPKDQPAHHYRLLGVDLFETDLDVIESAAARQISHVRSFSLGPYAELSQAVLNQLAKARSTLLNPQAKIAYDQKLEKSLASLVDSQRHDETQVPPERRASQGSNRGSSPASFKVTARTPVRKPRATKAPVWPYAAGVLIVILIPISFFVWRSARQDQLKSSLADSGSTIVESRAADVESGAADAQGPDSDPQNGERQQEALGANQTEPLSVPPQDLLYLLSASSTLPSQSSISSEPTATFAAEGEPAELGLVSSPDSTEPPGAASSNDVNTLPTNQTGVDSADGWIDLFNGRDLRGWYGGQSKNLQKVSDARRNQQWRVIDGELRWLGTRPDIDLFTIQEFQDFELSVEWKIPRDGDSGILLRGYPQVQIWDPGSRRMPKAAVGSGGLYNNKQHPSQPTSRADRGIGQWNHFLVRMSGNRVTVFLNDRRVVDRVEMENFRDRAQSIAARGPIGLQGHSQSVAFRKIRIREINIGSELEDSARGN
ncbi:MAG: DUF1080 domain-containing protein [Rubripirellula sp.]|nr:DUF1080 domain-containing protein [Rubripirellula sp.]